MLSGKQSIKIVKSKKEGNCNAAKYKNNLLKGQIKLLLPDKKNIATRIYMGKSRVVLLLKIGLIKRKD